MDSNPYNAPQGEIRADAETRKGSPVKAVLLGLVVDIVGTVVTTSLLAVAYMVLQARAGMTPEQLGQQMAALSPLSGFGLFLTAVGTGFSVLGGYVCARIVKADELRTAGWMAAGSVLFGLLSGSDKYTAGIHALLAVVGFAAILGGAMLGRQRNAKDRAA